MGRGAQEEKITMRLKLGSLAIAAGLLMGGPALADCSTEVAVAVNAQGK